MIDAIPGVMHLTAAAVPSAANLLAEVRDLAMPELILSVFACLALLVAAGIGPRHQRVAGWSSLVGIVMAIVSVVSIWMVQGAALPRIGLAGMYVVDELSLVFKCIALVASGMTIALSMRFLDEEHNERGEYYALVLFATVGMMLVPSGADLLSLFISLELMSLSVYVLVGYLRGDRRSNEAAIKYFMLGAFSSGVLLYGMSLVYGVAGSTRLVDLSVALPEALSGDGDATMLVAVGVALLVAGVAFKIAAAPFHVWAPDAYEGAPTPVAAFMSVGVKAASFALLVRIFIDGLGTVRVSVDGGWPGWEVALGVLAAVAMTWGNLAALTQKNAKRLLAYSAVAHSGYALLGIVAGNRLGYTGLILYLVVYVAMNLGAFGVLIALRRGAIEGDDIVDFRGLATRAPGMAALMTVFMLGLGGIPPTAGFVGKFYLFAALVEGGDRWMIGLAALALVNTAISAYYYLLFVKEMYSEAGDETAPALATSPGLIAALVVSGVLTLAIGVYPQPVIAISSAAAERLCLAPDPKAAETRAGERAVPGERERQR